jgi:hypothetical protein
LESIPESVHLRSTGTPEASVPAICSTVADTVDGVTTIHAEELDLSVSRVLNLVDETLESEVLTAMWGGQTAQVKLAWLTNSHAAPLKRIPILQSNQ